MKKILIATTALVMTAGVAAAEVTVGGDGRMGLAYNKSAVNKTSYTSRIRIAFTASGESDSGLAFGGSVRADNAVGGAAGTAGSVYISGAFGKLSMGDVDGAARAAVGHVSAKSLTGLGDPNESTYIANAGTDPSMQYMYSTGPVTLYLSSGNPGAGNAAYALGVNYAADTYSIALGYEDNNAGTTHVILGGSATFNGLEVKAIYGKASGTISGEQYAVSLGYTADALTVVGYFTDDSKIGGLEAYGIGASYDLGGGLSVVGGLAETKTAAGVSNTVADFGVSMSF